MSIDPALSPAGPADQDGKASHADLVIAGGGFAGLALAIALRLGLGSGFKVAVCDPGFAVPTSRDVRASALAAASCRLLNALGVWPAIATKAQPILDMTISDSRTHDAVRPTLLTFAGDVTPGEPFAQMVENADVLDALLAQARACEVELRPASVARFSDSRSGIEVRLSDGSALNGGLLIAADGARSRLRTLAGISVTAHAYDQAGIVATLGVEHDHGGRAEEHFLPAGPFAFLPLKERRGSIVWCESRSAAERYARLPSELFVEEVTRRLGHHLGEVRLLSTPRAFPLGVMMAREVARGRLALLGDAAHQIHPVAGQGLNLALRDVAALAEAIADAARLGLDIGGPDVLARYARWRRFDTLAMAAATDGLTRLFSNDIAPLRMMRDIGLGVVERMPALKSLFIRQAAGMVGDLPRLLRGEMV